MTQDQIAKEHLISQRINEAYGKLTNCPKCRGKGYIDTVDDKGYHRSIDCECKPQPTEKPR